MPECDKDVAAALLDEVESQGGRGDTGYSQTISLQIPIPLLERIDKTPDSNRSTLIRRAIRLYFLVVDLANEPETTNPRSKPRTIRSTK